MKSKFQVIYICTDFVITTLSFRNYIVRNTNFLQKN